MSCFPCFSSQRNKRTNSKIEHASPCKELSPSTSPENKKQKPGADPKNKKAEINQVGNGNINAQTFTFRDLATATKNFRQECLLGEGGFGRVYKGTLQGNGQVVAVKQLDRNGLQGNKEFLVEVLMLSLLHHPNLVNLVGYCADGDQRVLVYEFMSGGSVEDHLLDITPKQKPLDWFTRIKIALGAAKGLEYLHDKANPPVIYRDLKSSNILLDEGFNPKLSDFGLAKLGPVGDKMHVSSRVMGTYGYCAPEYARLGHLTLKSDVYSFGVVMLELITGRRAIDTTRSTEEQNLVAWAQPLFRDPKRFPDMADPLLNKQFPERDLNQAVAIAAMCLQEEASVRPLMSDVVTTLSFLSMVPEESFPAPVPAPTPHSEEKAMNEGENHNNHQKNANEYHRVNEDGDSSDHGDRDSSHAEDKDSSGHKDRSVRDQDEDGAKLMDRDTPDHQSGDNSKQQHGDSLDHGDEDSSDYEDEESVDHWDEDGENKNQQAVTETRQQSLISSHKSSISSRVGSTVSSSCKSSWRSHDGSVSSSCKSSRGSQRGIASLSHKSSGKSHDESVSLSHKASTRSSDGSVSSGYNSSKGSQNGSVSSGYSSSKGSQNGSVSSGRGHSSSRGSENGSVSVGCNSSRGSKGGSNLFARKSSRVSQDGSVCLDHSNSRGSENGSVHSS